ITEAFVAGVNAVIYEIYHPDPDQPLGIHDAHLRLIRKDRLWNAAERQEVESILTSLLEVCNQRAGLPSMQLPAEYIACMIARVVSPCNRLVAATRAPRGYAGIKATGLTEEPVIETVEPEVMVALVVAFSGGYQVPNRMESYDEVIIKHQQELRDDDNS
ncbi:MAG: hypothetical protein OXI63_18810, partial [Candidatus Poribacteria bacterium]|nr:hypothetical protein [Candidatus Poribacteria bacterium]